MLYWPVDITFSPNGTPWVLDWNNHLVREVTPAGKFELANGNAVRLNHPTDIVFGLDGSIYIADTYYSCVRMVNSQGIIDTIAGVCGKDGFAGDGGDATSALLDRPYGIELDASGNLYMSDTYNERVGLVSADPSVALASAKNTRKGPAAI
jgi:sugar lactone lactonase YvrE